MADTVFYNKRKLCYTDESDFTDFKGIGSDPLFKRYDSVNVIIKHYISPKYQGFLAEPYYQEGQIHWYVEDWVETPQCIKDLQGSEKEKYQKIKDEVISHYRQVCGNLPIDEMTILSAAINSIEDRFIYCYDGKVSLVAWGMRPDTSKRPVNGSWIKGLEYVQKYTITFDTGENGELTEPSRKKITRQAGSIITKKDIPEVMANEGFAFDGWQPNPIGYEVKGDVTFEAKYNGASQQPIPVIDEPMPPLMGKCIFLPGDFGSIIGQNVIERPYGETLTAYDIPRIEAFKGYEFAGWSSNPVGALFSGEKVFVAQYNKCQPWYKRFWKSIPAWLLWLLLGILILLAGALLFRNCSGGFGLTGCGRDKDSIDVDIDVVKPIDIIDGREYNGPIKGIVDENGEMPKFSVVPPIVGEHGEEPPIIDNEGAPNVIANRLNVYLEDDNADLNQWAQDFNAAYSGDNYQIIGCDPNVKLIQIMIPENERDKIREELPSKLPRQRFFVIDESIMSLFGNYKSNSDTSLNGWHLDATRAKQGWEITKGSNDVVVAIVDDGIDASHPIFDNRFYMAYNVFTQDRKLSVGEGHGTHVAGLAAGNGKFLSEGAAGIAQNVKIMPIQVFDNGYCTFSSLASGIMYAIHNGAHVVNISIGPSFEGLDQMPYDQQRQLAQQYFKNEELVFRRIIRKANEKNVILVFAAGNDNIMTAILPECRSAQTINVAAVDHNLRATGFTNYSVGTNISAPGADIYSSVPGGGFRSAQGTSMAAPIVAGAVALMRSIKPDLTVGQAIGVLQKTGIPTDGNNRYVPPMIQIDKALEALRSGDIPSMPVIDMQPIVNPNRGIDEPDVIVIGRDDTKNEVTVIDPDATRIVGGNGHDVVDPNRNNQVITNPNNPNDPNNPTGGNNNTDDYSAMRKLLDQLKAQRDALNQRIDEIEKNINK